MSRPNISLLFRYRDLVASTLKEHRNIIASEKRCLWGWWKRPTENARVEIWKYLTEQTKYGEKVWVGLFDSGSKHQADAVRLARVVRVIAPDLDAANGWSTPPLDEGARKLVPQYYRRSPFSRAWLELDTIEDEPFEFFGAYSFHGAPDLPGLGPEQLKLLDAKVILDAAELRMMDTTIWRVRLRQSGDRTERFLAPSVHVTQPVTQVPIQVPSEYVLHLSDMHFAADGFRKKHRWGYKGDATNPANLVDQICSSVKEKTEKLGLVLVTGDSAFVASKAEFDRACVELTSLFGVYDIPADRVVIVPGNHDIPFTKTPTEFFEGSGRELVPELELKEASATYRRFYEDLLRHEPHEQLYMGRRFVFPNGNVLEIAAVNSSSLQTGERYLAGMGRVAPGAFNTLASELGWKRNARTMALRVLMLHHHLIATEDVENPEEYYKGFGLAVDAQQILRESADYGVQLVLHGHRHRAFLWRSSVYRLPEHTEKRWHVGDVNIIGGGSAGSTDVEGANTFNLIRIGSGEVDVNIFKSNKNEGFRLFKTYTAGLEAKGGKLTMGQFLDSP